jgi:hypothetical protein
VEAVGFAIKGQERLLGGVEGSVAVSHHPQRDGEDPILVGTHQCVECFLITGDEAVEKFDVFSHGVNRTSNMYV